VPAGRPPKAGAGGLPRRSVEHRAYPVLCADAAYCAAPCAGRWPADPWACRCRQAGVITHSWRCDTVTDCYRDRPGHGPAGAGSRPIRAAAPSAVSAGWRRASAATPRSRPTPASSVGGEPVRAFAVEEAQFAGQGEPSSGGTTLSCGAARRGGATQPAPAQPGTQPTQRRAGSPSPPAGRRHPQTSTARPGTGQVPGALRADPPWIPQASPAEQRRHCRRTPPEEIRSFPHNDWGHHRAADLSTVTTISPSAVRRSPHRWPWFSPWADVGSPRRFRSAGASPPFRRWLGRAGTTGRR
jgi:hypothetical protein